MKKRLLLLIGVLTLVLSLSGPALADMTYVQELTVLTEYGWGMTTWVNGPTGDLEDAVTGAPDYDPVNFTGDALGWQQGYGSYMLDFGEVFSGDDVAITFWHFGGYNHDVPPVANNLVYMYISDDGTNWTPTYTEGVAGDVQLEDVLPGGETLYTTTYDLTDTFGLDASFRYLMIEKISGGPKTGKFVDAVGVSAVPVPGAVWLLGTGLLGVVGLRRRQS